VEEKTKNSLRIHSGLLLAEILCVSGFIVELFRAETGNGLSWAYVFEWPLFGGYAIYMWRKLLKESREGVPSPSHLPGLTPRSMSTTPIFTLSTNQLRLRLCRTAMATIRRLHRSISQQAGWPTRRSALSHHSLMRLELRQARIV